MRKVVLVVLVFCIIFSNLFLQVYGESTNIPNNLSNKYDYEWTGSIFTPYTGMGYGAYGKGVFVIVGHNGIIKTSANGQNWQLRESGTQNSLLAAAFNGQTFVAAGVNGTIITSNDGIKWNTQITDSASAFTKVLWNGNIFVAIGYTYPTGVLYTSKDGITWTQRMMKTSDSFTDIEWTGKLFVCVGSDGFVYTSEDGIEWKSKNVGNSKHLANIAYNGELLVAVTNSQVTFTSQDGINWTAEKIPEDKDWFDIAWDGQCFVAFGANGEMVAQIASVDGHTWEQKRSTGISEICTNGSVKLGVAYYGVCVSTDGKSWNSLSGRTYPPPPALRDISYNGTTMVSVADNGCYGGSDILVSIDQGSSWSIAGGTSKFVNAIEWSGNFFIGVGKGGTVVVSNDGIKWSNVESGISEDFVGITYGRGLLVALSATGNIYTSTDGKKWTFASGFENKLGKDILWNGEYYVAVANPIYGEESDKSPSALVSKDGVVWSINNMDTTGTINGLCLCDGKFIALDRYNKKLYFSEDGLEWKKKETGLELTTIAWDENKFIAGCSDGQIYISDDCNTWARSGCIRNYANRLLCLDNKVVAVGQTITMGIKTHNVLPIYKLTGYVSPEFIGGSDIKRDFVVDLTGPGIGIRAYTDDKGYFVIDGVPENLPGCTLKIMKANYLTKLFKDFVVNGDGQMYSADSPITMWAGDFSVGNFQDNCINMADVIELAKYFGSAAGDSIYRIDRDLNCDNAINMLDVMIIAKHFNSWVES